MSKNMNPDFKLETPHLALFCARRFSGRSYLMRYLVSLLTKNKKIKWISVICPTSDCTDDWTHVGEQNVSTEYSQKWVLDTIAKQKERRKTEPDYEGLIILDDCMDFIDLNDSALRKLYTTGRHYGINLWVSLQEMVANQSSTKLRSQVDYCFSFKQPEKAIEAMYSTYQPDGMDNWRELKTKLAACTTNYGCMVIDVRGGAVIHTIRAPAVEVKYNFKTKKTKKLIKKNKK